MRYTDPVFSSAHSGCCLLIVLEEALQTEQSRLGGMHGRKGSPQPKANLGSVTAEGRAEILSLSKQQQKDSRSHH